MDNKTQSSSNLRFRHNAVAPCAISDAADDRPKDYPLITRIPAREYTISQVDRDGTSGTNKGRKRGRIRTRKERSEEDRSLRYLVGIAAILSISIVGGLIYLTYLILVLDQNHIPFLQKYINGNQSLFSSWYHKWSNSSQFHTVLGEEHSHNRSNPTPLPPSSIYAIPNSMAHIGDKSDAYAQLRKDWDDRYPPDSPERSLRAVEELFATGNSLSSIYNRMVPPPLPSTPGTQNTKKNGTEISDKNWNYDIYNCPDDPPPGYPREYKTIDILKHWPATQNLPSGKYCHHHSNVTTNTNGKEGDVSSNTSCDGADDGTTAPVMAHLGLCVFDYNRDYGKAMRYRSKEMPFVVRNDPRVAETVERWNDETYRRKLFGSLYHSNSDGVADQDKGDNSANNDSLVVEESTRTVFHRAERSITNQVLFRHSGKKNTKKSKVPFGATTEILQMEDESPPMPPPTKLVSMTYDRWYDLAMEKEGFSAIDAETGIQYFDANLSRNKSLYYYYFRLVGCGEKEGCERNATEYLFDEMTFFQPRGSGEHGHEKASPSAQTSQEDDAQTQNELPKSSSSHSSQENLYLVQPEKQRGIHCRFGMPGMIAANHYDASRNAIAVLGGSRRYIISRPNQCPNLGLFPVGHPSARHSRVDWTTASEDYKNLEESQTLLGPLASSDNPPWVDYRRTLSRLVNNATSTEVVLQAGDVLYLPSYWFHFIISLTTNMQCNTRSGRDGRDDQTMTDCGFPPPNNSS